MSNVILLLFFLFLFYKHLYVLNLYQSVFLLLQQTHIYRFHLKDWYVYTLYILSTISPSISSGNSVGCCSSHISSYCSFSELVHSCHRGSSVDGMVTEGWNSRFTSSWWSRHSHSAGGVGYKLIDLFIFLYAWCRGDSPPLAGYY